jgi:hypothetical protein
MSCLAGPPAVVGEPAPSAGLEGDAVLALGGEAVGALPGLGGGAFSFLPAGGKAIFGDKIIYYDEF